MACAAAVWWTVTSAAPAVAQSQAPAATGGETILVLAAASLTEVLPRVADAWRARGAATVRFSFGATSRLAPQAVASSAADVFVSADDTWMAWLVDQGAVDPAAVRAVAGNGLVVVVPADEAGPPPTLEALGGLGTVALAGENVPAGRYARQALEAAGVWASVEPRVVRGGSVRGALEWVARGEAEAGVVYRTDAAVEPRVRVAVSLPVPPGGGVRYTAAPLRRSERSTAAEGFVAFLAGPEGTAILREAGFTEAAAPAAGRASPAAVPDPWSAVGLSVLVGLMATVVGLVPAVALGWLLARRDFPGKAVVSTAVLAPLVLPPVVTGFLLLTLLGANGPLGGWLAAVGITVPFTLLGATLAAFAVGLPLYVLSVRGAFEAVDHQYEEVSWTLGVPPRRTFLRVSLPLALPGIAAGAVLAFARALGEFGATVVLAGNVEGETRTIALAVYTLLESPEGRAATWTLVGASIVLSLAALLGYEALSRRQRRRLEDRGGR